MKVKVNYVGKIEGLTFEGVKRFKIDKNENNTFKRIRIEKDNGQVHLIAEKYVSGFEITDDKRKRKASELLDYIREYRQQCEDDCKGIERCEKCNQMLFDEIEAIVRRELDD